MQKYLDVFDKLLEHLEQKQSEAAAADAAIVSYLLEKLDQIIAADPRLEKQSDSIRFYREKIPSIFYEGGAPAYKADFLRQAKKERAIFKEMATQLGFLKP